MCSQDLSDSDLIHSPRVFNDLRCAVAYQLLWALQSSVWHLMDSGDLAHEELPGGRNELERVLGDWVNSIGYSWDRLYDELKAFGGDLNLSAPIKTVLLEVGTYFSEYWAVSLADAVQEWCSGQGSTKAKLYLHLAFCQRARITLAYIDELASTMPSDGITLPFFGSHQEYYSAIQRVAEAEWERRHQVLADDPSSTEKAFEQWLDIRNEIHQKALRHVSTSVAYTLTWVLGTRSPT